MKAKINEIFTSIQGEGTIVGYKQLFIRFCGCNLHCRYCDTEFSTGDYYTAEELFNEISRKYDLNSLHSISLTGGEPLLHTEFLKEFLPMLRGNKIYLETNATLSENLIEVKNFIDIISADIKLKSAAGQDTLALHEAFFNKARGIETFAKIVFDENITDEEIKACTNIAKKYDIAIILQPKMNGSTICVNSEFCSLISDKFIKEYKNVRLIPQVHKFLGVI